MPNHVAAFVDTVALAASASTAAGTTIARNALARAEERGTGSVPSEPEPQARSPLRTDPAAHRGAGSVPSEPEPQARSPLRTDPAAHRGAGSVPSEPEPQARSP